MPGGGSDRFQRAHQRGGALMNADQRIQRIRDANQRVCRISIKTMYGLDDVGTGILVGPNLILTCHHVIFDRDNRTLDHPDEIVIRFDISPDQDSTLEKQYKLKSGNWPQRVISKPENFTKDDNGDIHKLLDPLPDELDFTILELDGKPSEDVFPESNRGYFDLYATKPIAINRPGFGFSYPADYVSLQTSTGLIQGREVPNRYQYDIQTGAGSSGGLILDQDYQAVALHSAAKADYNQGIALIDILNFQGVKEILPLSSALPAQRSSIHEDIAKIIDDGPINETVPEDDRKRISLKMQAFGGLFFLLLLTCLITVTMLIFNGFDAHKVIVAINGIIVALTLCGAACATKILKLDFKKMASLPVVWAGAMIPMGGIDGVNIYSLFNQSSQVFIQFVKDGNGTKAGVTESFIGVENIASIPDGFDIADTYKTNITGVARFDVENNSDYTIGYLKQSGQKCYDHFPNLLQIEKNQSGHTEVGMHTLPCEGSEDGFQTLQLARLENHPVPEPDPVIVDIVRPRPSAPAPIPQRQEIIINRPGERPPPAITLPEREDSPQPQPVIVQPRPVISQPQPVIPQPIAQARTVDLSRLKLEAAYTYTVNIVSGADTKNKLSATGVILSPKLIMTVGYVFKPGTPELTIEAGKKSHSISDYDVKTFSSNKSDKDGIAIIILDKPIEKLTSPAPTISTPSNQDRKITLIGFKLGQDKVISEGVSRASKSPSEFFHTAQSTGGMGGGPIIDQASGNIIGVHFGRVNGLSKDKLAYPITPEIQAFVEKFN